LTEKEGSFIENSCSRQSNSGLLLCIKSQHVMKRRFIYIVLLAMVAMTSCLVSSLHPFYKEKDIYFDPVMTGSWLDGDSCLWVIEANMASTGILSPEESDNKYRITYYEEPEKAGVFVGTLFQINGVPYVDFYPDPDEDQCTTELTCWHHFPTHTLARIGMDHEGIMLYWYGEEWLTDLFEQNRIRIKHETVEIGPDLTRHVLTAPTGDLQKFIIKYANSPKIGIDVDKIFARGVTSSDEDWEDSGAFLKLTPYDGPLPAKKAIQVEPEHR